MDDSIKNNKETIQTPEKDIEESKEDIEEKLAIQDEKPKKDPNFISGKEILIMIVGIIIIFGAIFIIPQIFNQDPKTIDALHLENYNAKPGEKNYVYNGYSFLKLPDPRTNREFWYTQIKFDDQIYDLPMHYGPKELEHIPIVAISPFEDRNYTMIYISLDPDDDATISKAYLGLAVSEISKKLVEVKNYPIEAACTKNETYACLTRPIVDCNTTNEFVIKFNEETNNPRIILDKNCLTIEGSNETLLMAADKLIYKLLGIVN
jgi:hypothetical protein